MANKKRTEGPSLEDSLSVVQAAELLGVHFKTVRNWVLKGQLPGYQLGQRNVIRIQRKDVEAYIESCRVTVG